MTVGNAPARRSALFVIASGRVAQSTRAAPFPRLRRLRGDGRGEGVFPQAQTRGDAPPPPPPPPAATPPPPPPPQEARAARPPLLRPLRITHRPHASHTPT